MFDFEIILVPIFKNNLKLNYFFLLNFGTYRQNSVTCENFVKNCFIFYLCRTLLVYI